MRVKMRKPFRTLRVAIPLAVVLILALPSAAFASRTITGAAVDGQGSVWVQPGATLRVHMRVSTSGSDESDDWEATDWLFSTAFPYPGGRDGCDDTIDGGDVTSDVTNCLDSFTVTAPGSPGAYCLYLVARSQDCGNDTDLQINYTTLTVIVDDTILFDDHFRGTTDADNLETTPPPWTDDSDGGGSDAARRIDTSAPGTLQNGFDDGYLRLRLGAYVVKAISTAGRSGIRLWYNWGKDTDGDGSDDGSLVVQWKLTSSGTWINITTHNISGPDADPETAAVNWPFPSTANNTSIDIRFIGNTPENDDRAWVDNVIVTGVVAPSGPTKLAFTTSPFTGAYGDCLGSITVQTQNASGVPTNVTANTTVNLSSDATGTFFSNAACTSPATSVLIASGSNSASFYYKAGAAASSPTCP